MPRIKKGIVGEFWSEFEKQSEVVISNNEFTWKGFKIKAEILEDNDGAYLGFFALDSSGNIIKDQTVSTLKPLSDILNKLGFRNNHNYIGWKFTAEFGNSGPAFLSGTDFFQLTVEDNRSRIIKRLLDEYEIYIKRFREEAKKVESQI